MFRVFNMGVGMVAVCDGDGVEAVKAAAPDAVVIGQVTERTGDEQVNITE